ncbi:cytochrome P450 [Jimgerdemannia flammicorona]|uniref:Cytochrome P450 n=1 Tax=Jimgerdemannia flammicorona TaxID=994334 RepID=A0A433A1L1_9FUNG|nr:cytochrome P450 [Jimgerdemannia flammicorona]
MSFPSLKYAVPVFTAVFAAYIGIKIYGLFRVPKGIKNIPAIPLFTTLGYMLKGIPFDVREEHTINAILTEEGLARKWQRGEWVISLADPDFAKQFLTNIDTFPKALGEMDIFRRNKESSFARFLGGDTILFSNGEAHPDVSDQLFVHQTWKRYRMFSNRAFNPAVDTKYFGYFAIKMFAEIQRNGSLVEFRNLSQRITLDVMGKYMFGTDFQALDDQFSKYAEAYNHIVDSASDPLFIIFPFLEKMTYLFPKCAVVHKALDDMDELFYGIIERKRVEHRDPNYRSREDKSKDILDLMMEAEDSENGTQLSPQELRDNMAIFFIAGHDTTSSSLTNAVYYLAKYKDIQRKVREEIIRVLGDEPKDIIPSLKETKEMSYLTMVLREVRFIRLYNCI